MVWYRPKQLSLFLLNYLKIDAESNIFLSKILSRCNENNEMESAKDPD